MENKSIVQDFQHVLDQIEKADTITIFRHVLPDWDAIGSQMGLKKWLEFNYPDKTVLALGNDHIYEMDKADEQTIKNSLAIILDTSTEPRVQDERWKLASDSIRLDHHIFVAPIADFEVIDPKASATCEMVSLLLKQADKPISQEAAQVLYQGLIADNIGFTTQTVSDRTFEAAAYLRKHGADPVKAQMEIFGNDYDAFAFENVVRQKSHRKNNFLYSVINAQDYLNHGMSFSRAKEKVYLLGGFNQIENWALFTMQEDGTSYAASLRSRKIPVRDIAEEYGGGGHQCAAGIKNLSIAQVWEVIEKMSERSLEDPEQY